jgi:glycosyltransferase involved in cell wall biosynthesis
MASGVAICSSDRGPMPEILGTRSTYFDPENPESIVKAVRNMVEQGDIREAFRADARRRVESFTWDACSEKTWAALETACRRRKQ